MKARVKARDADQLAKPDIALFPFGRTASGELQVTGPSMPYMRPISTSAQVAFAAKRRYLGAKNAKLLLL
jgi:hypothetical protein